MKTAPPLAHPQLTVDVTIFTIKDGTLHVLLLRRPDDPFAGRLALPGGFMWRGETSRQSADRILQTKINAKNIFVEQLYTFDEPQRDPRGHVISIAYFALVPFDTLAKEALSPDAVLTPIQKAEELAFDHSAIVDLALKRLRNKLSYSTAAYSVLPKLFTLTQLQQAYEAILSKLLDKRNFRKKILSLDIIEQTDQKTAKAAHRPAVLYTFKTQGYMELGESIF